MPRTLAQNAQYIAETIKPAIKQAIEDKGVTVPSTDSFLDYADRIGEISGGGSGYQLKDLPTGSISTVSDAEPLPLNALKVSVEAWQEGSGDPSPSNVRPIHGWSTATITDKDDLQNPTQTKTYTHAFTDSQGNPLTCYGGEWNVVDGGMAEGYKYVDAGNFTWGKGLDAHGNPRFYTSGIGDIKNITADLPFDGICTHYARGTANQSYLGSKDGIIAKAGNLVLITDRSCDNMTGEEFKSHVSGVGIMYELATPTTIPQQALSIRMLEGTNNLYADCGEVLEGEYFGNKTNQIRVNNEIIAGGNSVTFAAESKYAEHAEVADNACTFSVDENGLLTISLVSGDSNNSLSSTRSVKSTTLPPEEEITNDKSEEEEIKDESVEEEPSENESEMTDETENEPSVEEEKDNDDGGEETPPEQNMR